MKLARMSIRVRLTLWFSISLVLILSLYSSGVFFWLKHNFIQQLEHQAHDDFELAEERLEVLPNGKVGIPTYTHAADELLDGSRFVDVWSPDGNLLYSSAARPMPKPPDSCFQNRRFKGAVTIESDIFQIHCGSHSVGNIPVVIRAARSQMTILHELNELFWIMLISLPLAVLAAGLLGYFLSRRALAPVTQMTEEARSITAEKLQKRLPVQNPNDELGRLALTFNDTFARLENSFEQMKRFTADASHELRTPLTALRSMGEVYLSKGQRDETGRPVIASMLEEVDRMRHLTDTLLTLSRADTGRIKIIKKSENLKEVCKKIIDLLSILAEEKKQSIQLEGDASIEVDIDVSILRQALTNLIDNAIKYSGDGSSIRVRIERLNNEVVIEVNDSGPGIAEEHISRIFERFYRIDKSRSRELGGTGLGLAITRWAVEINGGRIAVESQIGKGSIFRIYLPNFSPSNEY